jgi:hypothetical protein
VNEQEILKHQAYHEAGHVVMAWLGRRKIKSVWIGGAIKGGCTRCYKGEHSYETEMCEALAGALAEKINSGGICLFGIGLDFERAHDLYVKGAGSYMSLARAWETTAVLLTHPDNWRLVDGIARRLLEKKWLPGRSVDKIIREAIRIRTPNEKMKKRPAKNGTVEVLKVAKCGGPNGIRTRVTDVRGRCPNH